MGDRPLTGLIALALAPIALAYGSAGHTAPSPVPYPDEIVVTGERLTPAEARERAVAYVRHTGVIGNKDSVARWIDPICPRAIGVTVEHAELVVRRLRTIADEAGVPTAKPGCRPNVTVNFVGDGDAFVRSVAAGDRRALAEVPLPLRPALLSGNAPIRWWYSTEVRGSDGDRLVSIEPAHIRVDGGGSGNVLPSNGDSRILQTYKTGTISTGTARALRSATVVVDTVRTEGATLEAIAAYAALVAFAEMQPRETPLTGSILGLFGGDPPRSLTRLDMAFLRELYSLPLDRRARQQRGRLVRALQNEQSRF